MKVTIKSYQSVEEDPGMVFSEISNVDINGSRGQIYIHKDGDLIHRFGTANLSVTIEQESSTIASLAILANSETVEIGK